MSYISRHFVPIMLKFERTWETLGIPQRQNFVTIAQGILHVAAGIALPRRSCILISTLWLKKNAPTLADYNYDPVQSTFYWSAIVNIALSCAIFELTTAVW